MILEVGCIFSIFSEKNDILHINKHFFKKLFSIMIKEDCVLYVILIYIVHFSQSAINGKYS